MLTTQWRSAELPDNLAGFSVDNDHSRDHTEAHDDIAVRKFRDAVSVRPFFPPLLHSRDAIRFRIEMLPATPFPNDSPISCHFDQVVSIHLAVVFGAWRSAFHLRD